MASKPQIDSLIQAYLDEELSPSEKILFERELDKDESLYHRVEQARDVSEQLFNALKACRRTEDLVAGVMAHLPEMEGGQNARQAFAHEATWRAKHPKSRARWFFTVVPAFAPVVLAVLAFAIFQSWPLNEGKAPAVVGMVTALNGDTQLHDSESVASRKAALMSVLTAGDSIETSDGSDVLLAISGPTFIKARGDSRVKLLSARAVQLEKGSAWLQVAKHSERFRVRTAMGDITVFGTTFSVEAGKDQIVVTLEEGEVTVENGQDFVVLRPNEQAVLRNGQGAIQKVSVNALELLSWANEIQPEPAAHAAFKSNLLPLEGSVLQGEQMWWLDTHDRRGVQAISFTWQRVASDAPAMSYDVLVYNENMSPLFTRRLDASLFSNEAVQQAELQLPQGKELGGTATFIRMVPDSSSGAQEVLFKEVSLIGASAPEGQ